jgi:Ca2+/Na+ antiporter
MSSAVPPPEFSTLRAAQRLSALRKWFLLLVVLGLLAMVYVGYKVFFSYSEPQQAGDRDSSSISFLIPTAYAQSEQASPNQSNPDKRSSDRSSEIKQTIMIGIVAVLAILLLVSFGAVLFSKEPNKVAVAGDLLKTLLGFFIGVAITFFAA